MAETDYPETLTKLHDWAHEMTHTISDLRSLYGELESAINSGEGGPNNIILTPEQVATLGADMVTLKQQIIATCSAHNVEPVEIPD